MGEKTQKVSVLKFKSFMVSGQKRKVYVSTSMSVIMSVIIQRVQKSLDSSAVIYPNTDITRDAQTNYKRCSNRLQEMLKLFI